MTIFTTTIHEGMEGAPKDRPFLALYSYGWDLTTWDRHPWNPTTPDSYWSNSVMDRVQEDGTDTNPTGEFTHWMDLPPSL